jgi:hypothetical protein
MGTVSQGSDISGLTGDVLGTGRLVASVGSLYSGRARCWVDGCFVGTLLPPEPRDQAR